MNSFIYPILVSAVIIGSLFFYVYYKALQIFGKRMLKKMHVI